MRPKALLLTLAFSTLSAPAVAEDAIHVTFGSAGERQAFIFPTLPKDAPTDAIKTRADAVDVPIGDHKPNHAVFVWDRTTGNLASKSILSVKSGWDVKPEDYVDVAQVRVHVTNDGKPVAACNVSLDDHRRTESQLLTPSSDGTATFFAVKPGSIKVTIRYKDGGKDAAPVNQIFDLSLKRDEPEPVWNIAIPGKADVVGSAPTNAAKPGDKPVDKPNAKPADANEAPAKSTESAAAEKTSPKSEGSGSPLGGLFGMVAGLAIVGGIVWMLYAYTKKNTDQVASKLEQLGVQIPKPGDDPATADPGPAPVPIAPVPAPKIVLDDAAPTPLAATPVATPISTPAPATGSPRLTSESGGAVAEIQPGDNVVGRELGLWLSLASEGTVSRRHAVVSRNGDVVEVRDEGSTNGTFVNGRQITAPTVLSHGDAIQFGAVKFRYEG